MAPTPDREPLSHPQLQILDEGLEAIAAGLVRLLATWDTARSDPTSLDPRDDAGLSVPVGERPVSVTHDEASTCGRSA